MGQNLIFSQNVHTPVDKLIDSHRSSYCSLMLYFYHTLVVLLVQDQICLGKFSKGFNLGYFTETLLFEINSHIWLPFENFASHNPTLSNLLLSFSTGNTNYYIFTATITRNRFVVGFRYHRIYSLEISLNLLARDGDCLISKSVFWQTFKSFCLFAGLQNNYEYKNLEFRFEFSLLRNR